MNVQSIGECAGIVWRLLHGDNRRGEYKELKEASGLRDRELNAAIGWLAREGKIQAIGWLAREGKIQFSENEENHKGCLYLELSYYIG